MNSPMMRLIAAHRSLNREIRRETAALRPDALRLTQLKKRRLAVKDQLFEHLRTAGEIRQIARVLIGRVPALRF